jgi:hypothetical protein
LLVIAFTLAASGAAVRAAGSGRVANSE